MARDHVVMTWSHDANRNILGRAHANLMLDLGLYLSSTIFRVNYNVIVESIYAQNVTDGNAFLLLDLLISMHAHCDTDGNSYLTLDLLIDYQKNDKVIPFRPTDRCMDAADQVTHKSTAGWQVCCHHWKVSYTS